MADEVDTILARINQADRDHHARLVDIAASSADQQDRARAAETIDTINALTKAVLLGGDGSDFTEA